MKTTVKGPGEKPVESPCGHRRQIALHDPAGLTMRCEVCGAVLASSHKLWRSVEPSAA